MSPEYHQEDHPDEPATLLSASSPQIHRVIMFPPMLMTVKTMGTIRPGRCPRAEEAAQGQDHGIDQAA